MKLDPTRCRESVADGGRSVGFHQCGKLATRDGYCGLHHPDAVQKRHAERDARYDRETQLRDAQWAVRDKERDVVNAALAWGDADERDGVTAFDLAMAVGNLKTARADRDSLPKSSSPRS